MGGDLTWGGEHTKQYTDDVLQNCTPETYIILLTNEIYEPTQSNSIIAHFTTKLYNQLLFSDDINTCSSQETLDNYKLASVHTPVWQHLKYCLFRGGTEPGE